MLTLRRSEQLRAHLFVFCRQYLVTQAHVAAGNNTEEYTELPEYPEIKDLSFRSRQVAKDRQWYEIIKQVPTIEEKLIKINMPRYYGFNVVDLTDHFVPYNGLPATQHYTRTLFERLSSVDDDELNNQIDAFVEASRADVLDALEYAHDFFRQKQSNVDAETATLEDAVERERQLTQLIVEQLNRALIQVLGADCQHLHEAEIDYNPRHEAFLVVGGIKAPKSTVKSKSGREWQKEYGNDSIDRFIQYRSQPYLALRHRLQLPVWRQDFEITNIELAKTMPRFNYDPRTLGYFNTHRHATSIPGYWPGSHSCFGFLSFQSRAHLLLRPDSFDAEDRAAGLHAQAIQASYAWLLAQANYNGFNTYSELTYPMNTQTIITNGRQWSFYQYQLNTLLVHGEHVDDNPRVNICRGTDEMQLYEAITPDGKCIGFNDQVLRELLRFYINAPTVVRTKDELQPYLHREVRSIANYDNAEQREFLERTYKHLSANRKRHLEIPEIYLWEKLYKIDNKTRQMEAKRRFFEVGINPWKRTLDQHANKYIPRTCRPEGSKSRKKWKHTYYP